MNIIDHRRTVAPKDEIQIQWLTDDAIKDRLIKSKEYSNLNARAVKQLKMLQGLMQSTRLSSKIITRMYNHIDNFISHSGIGSLSVCRRGCAQCCGVPVDVSEIEAMYISEMTGAKFDFNAARSRGGMCPFNKNNQCSIYEFRPIPCRVFLSIDSPVPCYENKPHSIFTIMSHPAINQAQLWLAQAKTEDAIGIMDIRHYFGPQS